MDFTMCLPTTRRLEQLEEEENSDSEESNKHQAKIKGESREWDNLENAVVALFQRHELDNKVVPKLHLCIRILLEKETGSFLFEWCQTKLFTKGMIILRETLKQSTGRRFLDNLEQTWIFFFQEILPLLQTIFLPLRVKQGFTIRKAALIRFRDVIVMKIDMLSAFEAVNFQVNPGIKQMFLILQHVHDPSRPNENRLELEKLIARIIVPYLGYYGYYEGGPDPIIESNEPAMASQRKSIADARRVSRPLSVQPIQLDRLEDIFHEAVARTSSFSDDK